MSILDVAIEVVEGEILEATPVDERSVFVRTHVRIMKNAKSARVTFLSNRQIAAQLRTHAKISAEGRQCGSVFLIDQLSILGKLRALSYV